MFTIENLFHFPQNLTKLDNLAVQGQHQGHFILFCYPNFLCNILFIWLIPLSL